MIRNIVFAISFLVAFSGCGSGNKREEGSCEPSNTTPGGTIVCTVGGFEEGCTPFVGDQPVVASRILEGGVEIVAPNRIGTFDVSYACGASDRTTIARGIVISAPSLPGEGETTPPLPTDPPGGGEAEGPAVSPEEPTEPVPPGEGTEDPPAPPEVGPLTVSLDPELLHETRLGLIKVNWKTEGGPPPQWIELLISQPSSTECEGLAVNPSGTELIEGSLNYETYQYFISGEKCLEDDSNCPHRSLLPASMIEGTTFCRIDLMVHPTGHFYTLMNERELKLAVLAGGEEGNVQATWVGDAPTPSIEAPEVTISGSAPETIVSFRYRNATRVLMLTPGCGPSDPMPDNPDGSGDFEKRCPLTKSQYFYMIAQGVGGPSHKVTEKFFLNCEDPQLTLHHGALYEEGADDIPLCAADHPAWWRSCNKKGELSLIGEVTRTCTIKRVLEDQVSTQAVPWIEGLQIVALGPSGAFCAMGGLKKITGPELPEGVSLSGSRLRLNARLQRNHLCSRYEFRVQDLGFDGGPWHLYRVRKDFHYVPRFELEGPSITGEAGTAAQEGRMPASDRCQYNLPTDPCDKNIHYCDMRASTEEFCALDWEADAIGGECSNYGNFHPREYRWTWNARHCRLLRSTCGHLEEASIFHQTDSFGTYPLQTGNFADPQRLDGRDCEVICEPYYSTCEGPGCAGWGTISRSYGYEGCPNRRCFGPVMCGQGTDPPLWWIGVFP